MKRNGPILFIVLVINTFGATSDYVKQLDDDTTWPVYRSFGQPSAVTTDKLGNVYVFHRGDRIWDATSFNGNEVFTHAADGPIRNNTIVILRPNGTLISMTGRDLFYLPHGIFVDDHDNIWITDVALHQVIKFPPANKSKEIDDLGPALITKGTPLQPGLNNNMFCKPAAVVVDSRSGDFFVADGYCNSRIVKFDKDGRFLLEWGEKNKKVVCPASTNVYGNGELQILETIFDDLIARREGRPTFLQWITMGISSQFLVLVLGPYSLFVPHSLTLNEGRNHLMVGDRENRRILCYDENGNFIHEIRNNNRMFGIAYSTLLDKLFAVTGTTFLTPGSGIMYSMDNETKEVDFFPAKGLHAAHDIAVSPDGVHVYIVELNPYVVWRFTVGIGGQRRKGSPTWVPPLAKSVPPIYEPLGNEESSTKSKSEISTAGAVSSAVEPKPEIGEGPADSAGNLGANQLAISLVSATVLLALIIFVCHFLRKRGYTDYSETRGLILDDDLG